MDLPVEIEESLKDCTAEEAAAARKFYDENPGMVKIHKAQILGQRDVSRKYQEIGAKEKEAAAQKAAADALFTKNTEWFRDSEADFNRLEAENAKFKAELEKVKSGAPPNGTSAVDLTKYDNLISSLTKKIEATEKALKDSQAAIGQQLDSGGMWLLQVGAQARAYERTYNKPFDDIAFVKFMNENKLADPVKGLEMFTAADRQAKLLEDQKITLRKEWEAEQAAKSVPYANGTGAMIEKGPLQYYMERDAKGPQTTQQAAVAAAAELAAEGKG